ncbi:MAG: hypothetical protein HY541_00770 [Deltaproteobacteria bacterium]|nr:hypothetical protein [Deltaproteobacteria bacterium]
MKIITGIKKQWPMWMFLMAVGLVPTGCAHEMQPARAMSSDSTNSMLCKETYHQCRGNCAASEKGNVMEKCGEQCEQDVDTCLLQAPEQK